MKSAERVMNTIPIIFNQRAINRTVIGGTEKAEVVKRMFQNITKDFDENQNSNEEVELNKSGIKETIKKDEYLSSLNIVDRFFPSSKRCSRCRNIKLNLSLTERIYKCEECGLIIDRDINAAINIRHIAFEKQNLIGC